MAGELVTQDWHVEFNGLLTGGDTGYALVQIEGLLDMPAVRSADQVLLRRHGAHPGDDFVDARSIVLTYELHDDSEQGFASLVSSLQAALAPGGAELPLVFQIPGVAGGEKAQVWARPKRRQLPVNLEFFYRLPIATIEMVATDPMIYSATESMGATTLPSAGGGVTFPMVAPITFGAVSTGGSLTAVNGGSFDADVTFRIDGPATNPRIESLTAGRTIALNMTIGAGEFVVIDTKSRTVLLGGTASRYSFLDTDSRWFALAPGSNVITFRASTPTVATLSAAWRSAWL